MIYLKTFKKKEPALSIINQDKTRQIKRDSLAFLGLMTEPTNFFGQYSFKFQGKLKVVAASRQWPRQDSQYYLYFWQMKCLNKVWIEGFMLVFLRLLVRYSRKFRKNVPYNLWYSRYFHHDVLCWNIWQNIYVSELFIVSDEVFIEIGAR